MSNWVDDEVKFYDFIWTTGLSAHADCIHEELVENFQEGGDKFELMKLKILEKYPTRKSALQALILKERKNELSN